jgi:tetratricopeptide (TPR) repeat protein
LVAALLLTGRPEEALSGFNSVIQQDSSAAWALVGRGLGYVLMDREDEDDVLGDFSRAIDLDSTSAAAYICRGMVYEEKGRKEDAAADYTLAAELEPSFRDVLAILRSRVV